MPIERPRLPNRPFDGTLPLVHHRSLPRQIDVAQQEHRARLDGLVHDELGSACETNEPVDEARQDEVNVGEGWVGGAGYALLVYVRCLASVNSFDGSTRAYQW